MTIISQGESNMVPMERAVVRVNSWREDDDLDLYWPRRRARKGGPNWNIMAELGVDREVFLGEYDGEEEAYAAMERIARAAEDGSAVCRMPPRGFLADGKVISDIKFGDGLRPLRVFPDSDGGDSDRRTIDDIKSGKGLRPLGRGV